MTEVTKWLSLINMKVLNLLNLAFTLLQKILRTNINDELQIRTNIYDEPVD